MIAIVAPKAPPKHITTRNEDDEDDEDLVSPLRFRAIFFFLFSRIYSFWLIIT
jgi:hypothetical protein